MTIQTTSILTFFFLQVSQCLEILLESELNLENRYERFRDKEDRFNRTLMHYAVEHGFLDVTKTLAKKCPLLLALQTTEQIEPKKIKCLLPVEVALLAEKDDVASYLIRMMWHERYIQKLFASWKYQIRISLVHKVSATWNKFLV